MHQVTQAIKSLSLSKGVPVREFEYLGKRGEFYIFNKAHRTVHHLSGDSLLEVEGAYDSLYSEFDPAAPVVRESRDFDDYATRSEINQGIADELIEDLRAALDAGQIEGVTIKRFELIPDDLAMDFFQKNVDAKLQAAVGSPEEAALYGETNKTNIFHNFDCKMKLDRDNQFGLMTEKKNKGKGKSKDSKSIFIDPVSV